MKRLIIVTDSSQITNIERNALTEFLKAQRWSVWHWFQDLWLVDEVPPSTDLGELRERIKFVIPSLLSILILNADGRQDHAGYVPVGSIAWLNEHWQARD